MPHRVSGIENPRPSGPDCFADVFVFLFLVLAVLCDGLVGRVVLCPFFFFILRAIG